MSVLKGALLALALLALGTQANADENNVDWQQLLYRAKPETQTEWATRYENGEGIDRDYTRALSLYCAAARKGYALAQYQLGWMYVYGRGVEQDDSVAAAWFRLAAAGGIDEAKNMLTIIDGGDKKKKPLCIQPPPSAPGLAQANNRLGSTVAPKQRRYIEAMVHQLAPHYGLDPHLVLTVIQVESAFQTQAISPKNAQGLMQLIPKTADRFGVKDTLDISQNLHGGMTYLRWLLDFFKGDITLALAGYNAGENAVVKYQGIPPYPETQAYVARIMQLYGIPDYLLTSQAKRPAAQRWRSGG